MMRKMPHTALTRTQSHLIIVTLELKHMMEMGLWAQLATIASFGGVFRIAPPLTVTEDQIDRALAIIEEALRKTPGTQALSQSIDYKL